MLPVACLRNPHSENSRFSCKSGLCRINHVLIHTPETRFSNGEPTHTSCRTLVAICRFDPARVAKAMLKKRQQIGPRRLLLNSYLERLHKFCQPTAGINTCGSTQSFSEDGTNGKRFRTNLGNHRNTNQPLKTWRTQSYMTRHTTDTRKHLYEVECQETQCCKPSQKKKETQFWPRVKLWEECILPESKNNAFMESQFKPSCGVAIPIMWFIFWVFDSTVWIGCSNGMT